MNWHNIPIMNGQKNLFHEFYFPWCLVPNSKRKRKTNHQEVKHLTHCPEMCVLLGSWSLFTWGSSGLQVSQPPPCQPPGEEPAFLSSARFSNTLCFLSLESSKCCLIESYALQNTNRTHERESSDFFSWWYIRLSQAKWTQVCRDTHTHT